MNPFGNVRQVPGVGFVEMPTANGRGSLHGEADVMMISGLGADQPTETRRSDTGQVVATEGAFTLSAAFTQKVKIFGIEIPLWALVLIGAGILGAGWVFFRKYRK